MRIFIRIKQKQKATTMTTDHYSTLQLPLASENFVLNGIHPKTSTLIKGTWNVTAYGKDARYA
jgi:hypothetical protein